MSKDGQSEWLEVKGESTAAAATAAAITTATATATTATATAAFDAAEILATMYSMGSIRSHAHLSIRTVSIGSAEFHRDSAKNDNDA